MHLSTSMEKLSMVPETIYQIGNVTERTKQQVDKLAEETYKSFNSVIFNLLFTIHYGQLKK
jgi:hypothetical protein